MKKNTVTKNFILNSFIVISFATTMLNPYSTESVYGIQQKGDMVEYTMNVREKLEFPYQNNKNIKEHEELSTGSVLLTHMDYNSFKALSGVEFKIVDEKGNNVKVGLITDKFGEISVSGLKVGKYNFIETRSINGYVHDTTPMGFTIVGNQTEPTQVQIFSKTKRNNNKVVLKGSIQAKK